jgi:hypothetical protein
MTDISWDTDISWGEEELLLRNTFYNPTGTFETPTDYRAHIQANGHLFKAQQEPDEMPQWEETPQRSVFYSGGYNQDHAWAFCHANPDYHMIQETLGGDWLVRQDLPEYFRHNEVTSIWQEAARQYARMAQGDVVAFIRGAEPSDMFFEVELPELLFNEKVTHINGIDRQTLVERFVSINNLHESVYQQGTKEGTSTNNQEASLSKQELPSSNQEPALSNDVSRISSRSGFPGYHVIFEQIMEATPNPQTVYMSRGKRLNICQSEQEAKLETIQADKSHQSGMVRTHLTMSSPEQGTHQVHTTQHDYDYD